MILRKDNPVSRIWRSFEGFMQIYELATRNYGRFGRKKWCFMDENYVTNYWVI
jgi:hypothetical protein